MSRSSFTTGFALTLLCAAASPALAGPPWISAEYPANPHDRETRGALVVLHTYHHAGAQARPVTGRAEGVVGGRRQSVPLQLVQTSRPGVWAVRGSVPREGSWVLVLNLEGEGRKAEASALVALGPRGEVTAVRVPSDAREGWTIPRAATTREVDEMLRRTTAYAQAEHRLGMVRIPSTAPLVAGAGLMLLLPVGWAARRRSRRGA